MNIYKPIINKYANKVGLFCNARDEKNIKEWVAHHLIIGFDIIVIFDHKSIIPIKKVLEKFDKRVNIIYINYPDGNIKQKLMNKATYIANKISLDWFIYLDADEFIILNQPFNNIKQFLNTYSNADSVAINWLLFGSNNLIHDPSGLIIENYTKSDKILDKHVKTFVRPKLVKFSDNPHFYHMLNPSKMTGIQRTILTPPYYFNNINIEFNKASAYIAHYIYQSEESYINRKIQKIADDGSIRQNIGKKIHLLHNEIENLQPQKYAENIKQFLHKV